jgi:hypothetical protein
VIDSPFLLGFNITRISVRVKAPGLISIIDESHSAALHKPKLGRIYTCMGR